MSLLKKLIVATKERGNEEIIDCRLINLMSAAPAVVEDVAKQRVRAVLEFTDGDTKVQRDAYLFNEAVVGAPTFIPAGGLEARATLREVDGKDQSGAATKYVNVVHLGVKA